uniref:Secreted protein n=1 Tax=Cacopsylla melanoneura TaxID=428564 RepID=A0A8D8TA82_9HEMI
MLTLTTSLNDMKLLFACFLIGPACVLTSQRSLCHGKKVPNCTEKFKSRLYQKHFRLRNVFVKQSKITFAEFLSYTFYSTNFVGRDLTWNRKKTTNPISN